MRRRNKQFTLLALIYSCIILSSTPLFVADASAFQANDVILGPGESMYVLASVNSFFLDAAFVYSFSANNTGLNTYLLAQNSGAAFASTGNIGPIVAGDVRISQGTRQAATGIVYFGMQWEMETVYYLAIVNPTVSDIYVINATLIGTVQCNLWMIVALAGATCALLIIVIILGVKLKKLKK